MRIINYWFIGKQSEGVLLVGNLRQSNLSMFFLQIKKFFHVFHNDLHTKRI